MSDFPIKPLGSLLFVEPLQLEATVAVVIDPRKGWRGRVVASGPGEPKADGSVVPNECGVGDIIRLKPTNAVEAVFNQTRVWIVKDADVLAVESA